MTTGYSLGIDGRTYRPIPPCWLAHPAATDHEGDGPRCLAVSVAIRDGRWLRVRYAHPV